MNILLSLIHLSSKDMETAVTKGMAYDFQYIIIYTKTFSELKSKNKNNNKNNNKNDNTKTRTFAAEEIDFYNPEDRIFYQVSSWSFAFFLLSAKQML